LGLEQAFWHFKRGLLLILFLDSDVVVSPPNIQGCEEFLPMKGFQDLLYLWDWIDVLYYLLVYFVIILQWSQHPIFLFDEEPWG
jgi:hypothetical protein